jgi:hypothetical protein
MEFSPFGQDVIPPLAGKGNPAIILLWLAGKLPFLLDEFLNFY